MSKVLLQTYIEYLRGEVEDSQKINHHGKEMEVEGGKIVKISDVGGVLPDESSPVVPFTG